MKDLKKETTLTEVGSIVKIDLEKINDNISTDITQLISKYPYGKVLGYRITDGTDIGLILRLKDGRSVWFFKDETNSNLNTSDTNNLVITTDSNGLIVSSSLTYVLNPLNFLKWLTYSLKDIF